MAKQLTYRSLQNLGVNGLNTQDSPLTLDTSWLTLADNVLIRETGVVSIRKGFRQKILKSTSSISPAPSTAKVGSLVEHNDSGTNKVLAAVEDKVYTIDFTNPSTPYTGPFSTGGAGSDWQFINFNSNLYGVQDSSDLVEYNSGTWSKVKDLTGYSGPSGITDFDPSCGMGYYGRLWVGGVSESKDTLFYSDLLIPKIWYNTTATTSITSGVSYIVNTVASEGTTITNGVGYKITEFKELTSVTNGEFYIITAMQEDSTSWSSDFNGGGSDSPAVGDRYEATSTGSLTEGNAVRRADWNDLGGPIDSNIGDTFVATSTNTDISSYGKVEPDWTHIGGPEIANANDIFTSTSTTDITQYGDVVPNYGSAGIINLKTVWGTDEIVAIAPFYGKLVIFGKHNIVIYNNPSDTSALTLDEVIRGIGCVSRDSVQAIGDDIVFLSDTGLRSLARTAEKDKVPLVDLSLNIKNDLIKDIAISTNVKSVYLEDEGLYIMSFVDVPSTYVFDVKHNTPNGVPRATKWTFNSGIGPASFAFTDSMGLLMGSKDGSIATYQDYVDRVYVSPSSTTTKTYLSRFITTWIAMGEGVASALLKTLKATFDGGVSTDVTINWYKDFGIDAFNSNQKTLTPTSSGTSALYGVSEFGIAEFSPLIGQREYSIPLKGSVKHLKIGIDTVVNDSLVSVQDLTLLYKQGKIR